MKNHKKSISIGIALACSIGLVVFGALYYKTALPIQMSYKKTNHQVDKPVSIALNQSMVEIDVDKIKLEPKVEGEWRYKKGNLIDDAVVTFVPKKYFTANTKYSVDFPEVQRPLLGEKTLPDVTFTTQKAPDIAKTGLAALADDAKLGVEGAIVVSLASKNKGLRTLELRTTPAIAMKRTVADDRTYTWTPEQQLPHSTDITLEVVDIKNNEVLLKKKHTTVDVPALKTRVKATDVTDTDTLKLVFNAAVDEKSRDKVQFDMQGKGAWENDTTYVFAPKELAPGARYSYTVKKDLRTQEGGVTQEDATYTFATRGAVQVVRMGPYGDGLGQAAQDIFFTFNRAVDTSVAERAVTVRGGEVVKKYWKGTTLYVSVKNLGFQQTISAQVAAGVKNTTFGLPTARAYSMSFTTEARTIKHAVPYYRQSFAASCTGATSRMVLAWKGVATDEMSIIQRMGYNPRPMDKDKDPHEWDDPMEMFVGDVNGRTLDTGAGPDAPPVAKAIRSYGVNASVANGVSAGWIAQQIHAGRAVIMFGATRPTGTFSWKTPSGRTAVMNKSSHVTVVYGVKGEPDRPLGFYVHDPYGSSSYWSTGAVAANIARDPHRQAIAVY